VREDEIKLKTKIDSEKQKFEKIKKLFPHFIQNLFDDILI